MGKNKSTKSDGVEYFADTQNLENQKRISKGNIKKSVLETKTK
ncbi:hypothetical protein Cpap_0756 [Ruminiclostridium papyrosolvens DSM 2782]|uniref:Uncharacterized protein n=1 Tax=Ruminiclostridium papyrosolvens DSM 2782 TaxID=588581 RepID=F1TGD8_9FIRM|nr:hypothetical protein [Ruminiclostridium papyrosolvens]EGD46503.1 hypothetical protein Cpap_0756 [Ruminiclostridium papyrosolvens DSM 2782]WES35234.1 hypothetical protein P0092_04425 [Ruminiclostridium papyrosolvens DSM 2782]